MGRIMRKISKKLIVASIGLSAIAAGMFGMSVIMNDSVASHERSLLQGKVGAQQVNVKSKSTKQEIGHTYCMIALDAYAHRGLSIVGSPSIVTNGCDVHSNSNSVALNTDTDYGAADFNPVRDSGYYGGSVSHNTALRRSDVDQVNDPLIDLIAPEPSNCDENNTILREGKVTLNPGTYCGGIIALSATQIKLNPGIYIMKNGPLFLGGSATLSGENVGFYFHGNNAVFGFGGATKVSLTAPKTGKMAGILFFEDRNAYPNREFVIRSSDAQLLEGAIYLPKATLVIDQVSHIGQKSNWTSIVSNRIEIKNGPKLVLNSDYANSQVPVPFNPSSSSEMASLLR